MNPVEVALNDLHAALSRFVALLEQESQCLRDLQAEDLASVVADKTQHAEYINTAWNSLMLATGVKTDQAGELDAAMAADTGLEKKWQNIKQLVQQVGRLNQGNSTLIEAQLRRTRQALDVLQHAADRGTLYGANGLMLDNFQHLHTLDKA